MKNKNKVMLGEVLKAVETIVEASRTEGGSRAVIAALSDQFNPETVAMIGTINDNYSDTLERMRDAFGVE